MRRTLLLLTLVGALLFACAGVVLAQQSTQPEDAQSENGQSDQKVEELKLEEAKPGEPGPLSALQEQAINEGPLVPDEDAYEQLKAEANEKAEQSSGESASDESAVQSALDEGASSPESGAPVTVTGSVGLNDPGVGPSDSTSAVSPERYIELVNRKFGIYDRGNNLLSQGTLEQLTGFTGANTFDPQVIWDPDTNRYYYTADIVYSSSDNRLAFGFSKTATPSSAADFCQYALLNGSRFEDYPKLGDTQNRVLIGANAFSTTSYLGSDLFSFTKPPSGSTCPSAGSFSVGSALNLANTFTPVPAQQTDASTTGYMTSIPLSIFNTGSASQLLLYDVVESGSTFTLTQKPLNVPTYSIPPANADQPVSSTGLDTLDARNTQAVSANNPSRGNQVSLWTQHTILGGDGAGVKWYEIKPTGTPSVLQSENIAAVGADFFNGAISPDRVVNGPTQAFGDNMVLGLNASSESLNPSVLTASRIGTNPTSFTFVFQSPSHLADFTCSNPIRGCRWGDYASMTPDPITAAFGRGLVLYTTQFAQSTGSSSSSGWGTVNLTLYP